MDFSGSNYATNDNIKFTTARAAERHHPLRHRQRRRFRRAGNGANVTAYIGYVTSPAGWNATSNVKLTNVGNITLGSNARSIR